MSPNPSNSKRALEPDLIVEVEGKFFAVHKEILARNSWVIAKRLAANHKREILEFKFISPQAFQIIRDLMYGNKSPPKNYAILEEVFKAASILKINKLRTLTSKMILEVMSCENVGLVYQTGLDHDDNEMRASAFELAKLFCPL